MENLTLRDVFDMLKRQRLAFILPCIVVTLIGIAAGVMWSNFKATATIQVQPADIAQQVVTPLGTPATSVVQAFADQQIQQIYETVTSTSALVDIITKFNLYPDERKTRPLADLVNTMQLRKIKLNLEGTDLSNPLSAQRLGPSQLSAIAFDLSFTYPNPLLAQQVTNELVSRFLDEDVKERRQQAKATADFLDKQIADLEATMAVQEKKMADFRAQHAGGRPEDLALNLQMQATATQNVLSIQSQLNSAEQQRGNVMAQLAQAEPYSRVLEGGQVLTTPDIELKALKAQLATMSGQYGPQHPDVLKLKRQIAALEGSTGKSGDQRMDSANLKSQIADLRTNLAAAEQTYGPQHPDVLALRRQLAALEKQQSTPREQPADGLKKDADNPAYMMLTAQLNGLVAQQKALETQLGEARAEQKKYEINIAQTPVVEQEQSALSRDYTNAQARYAELKEKKMSADMQQQMAQNRTDQRMVVLNAPELPSGTTPPRWAFVLGGFLLSIFIGFGGAYLAESMSRTVHGARHLVELTGLVPLVAIPHIFTRAERRKIVRTRIQLASAAIIAVVVMGAVVDQYVMPIDVFWSVVSNRLGLS